MSRWHITSRTIAAMVFGLIVANSIGAFLSLAIPGPLIRNSMYLMVFGFIIYAAIILWVFAVERLRTVWWGLLSAFVLTAGGSFLLILLGVGR
ncbi:MAG: hypothetical protein AAF351_03645 [Pseudomonadota bacterium]